MNESLTGTHRRHVPVRLDRDRWVTRRIRRRVLVAVHTVTAGQRLLEAVRLLEGDARIQVFFSAAPDVFSGGVPEFLGELRGLVLPWSQALQTPFDLALAAGLGGVHELHAPVLLLPHGAGHNKLIPAGARGRTVGPRGVYGFSRQGLVRDGNLVPEAMALAHHEELARLGRECPEAVCAAEVVGDPCYDRLVASLPSRALYREALGTGARQELVVACSTWGPHSMLGQGFELLERLLTELPRDRYRVALTMHPHVWHTHSEWQVHSWLAGLGRAGLAVLHPQADWVGAFAAADYLVGDHGSALLYAAVTGAPALLAGSPEAEVDPGSPMADLRSFASRLRPDRPLARQLRRSATTYRPHDYARVAARISSEPGGFDRRMRALLYRKLRMRAPAAAAEPQTARLPRLLRHDEPGRVR